MNRELIAQKVTADGEGFITLYQLDETKYATWRSNRETPKDTYWGHYFENVVDAVRDYDNRS